MISSGLLPTGDRYMIRTEKNMNGDYLPGALGKNIQVPERKKGSSFLLDQDAKF